MRKAERAKRLQCRLQFEGLPEGWRTEGREGACGALAGA